ncbi:MAG TPA: DUF882 domain-containing protein [Steroidobacteraceae bacterium]|jgi:uncharacterized protein YcbK (DUF882 family)|nr:DUF882 domain-containing protein [Steroidobacteraceae bacterium]
MNDSWTRRSFLKNAVAAGGGIALAHVLPARGATVSETPAVERAIELYNTHTSETVSVVYRRGTEYVTRAIDSLRNLMRDHRNDAVHDIDVGLYDQLFELALAAGHDARFQVISGYRSAQSNAQMAARPGSGVAKHSLHIEGRAIDVRLHGCSCSDLRDLALTAARGGVGYYRRSDFVHLDTGRFRTWNG